MLKQIYLNNLFFYVLSGIAVLFAIAFTVNWIFFAALIVLSIFIAIFLIDTFLLFRKGFSVVILRTMPGIFSLGDKNTVDFKVENPNNIMLFLKLIDELPYQFQERDFLITLQLNAFESKTVDYVVVPTQRGAYEFRNTNIFSKTMIGLVSRKDVVTGNHKVAVFPSTVLMKKFELFAFNRNTGQLGSRKIRKIGHSYEFDHIQNYVSGDDPRSINWKATGRRAELMVNHFMDEKAQQVYCLLDKSRGMQMPFNGLTLLDHAINTTLVVLNIALLKFDNAGLISFSNKIGNVIKAGSGKHQLHKIYNALYNEKENRLEADYELLYNAIRKIVGGHSLLFLFTNFESVYAMERVMPLLRRINNFHLLVVVFFKNSKIQELANSEYTDIVSIYEKTIARKFIAEKELIVQELKRHKIQVVYTSPEELPTNTINKYLELKSRGLV
ncbi:MAG: DUF58 domain-containing protein [Bacteroidales bacterium]|nr:DUF58 domain-containing protein [Bacteroidales bacterium]